MADKEMNELNLDQLENAVGGTKPKLPPLGAKERAYSLQSEDTAFPQAIRLSLPHSITSRAISETISSDPL